MVVIVILLAIAVVLVNARVSKVEKQLNAVIDALIEDAEHDYEERIEKMFNFLTEGLDPEDDVD